MNSSNRRVNLAQLIVILVAIAAQAEIARGQEVFVDGGSAGTTPLNNIVGEYTATGAAINASLLTGRSTTFSLVTSGNDLYVSNYYTGTVDEYNATTGAPIAMSLVSGLPNIDGIAVTNGNLYISNVTNHAVGEYNATTGAAINPLFINLTDQFPGPMVATGNSLYEVESGGVVEYNATTGAQNASFNYAGEGGTPLGIAVSGGDLFVDIAGKIGEFDANTGAAINTSFIKNLPNNTGAIAAWNNDIFFTTTTGVSEYTTSGTLVSSSLIAGLNWGNDNWGNAIFVAAPEPSSWLMLAIGSAALLAFRRGKKRTRR